MNKQCFNLLHKTIAVLMAVLVLSGILSACGSSPGAGNGTSGNNSSTAAAADSQSPMDSGNNSQNDASEKDSGTETADNNDSVPAATSLDPSVVYKDEEETVLDTDELTIAVTGYDPAYVNTGVKEDASDDITDFAMKLRLENRTEEKMYIEYSCGSINRFGVESPEFYTAEGEYEGVGVTIPEGEKINVQLEYPVSTLAGAGITSVDEIVFTLTDQTDWENEKEIGTFTVYPTGKKPEEIVKADPVSVDDLNILEENNDFTFAAFKNPEKAASMLSTVTGQDNLIKFYAVNKTKKPVTFSVYEAAVDNIPYYFYITFKDENGNTREEKSILSRGEYPETLLTCMPGCAAIGYFWMDTDFMADNSIESPGDISEFSFGLGVSDSEKVLYSGTLAFCPADGSPMDTASVTADSSSKNSTEKPAYQSVEYVSTKADVFENDAFKITAVGYDPAYVNPKTWMEAFAAYLEIENKTEKEYTFREYDSSVAVNRLAGFSTEGYGQYTIAAGEKGQFRLLIDPTDFSKYGIQSVDEIRFTVSAESTEYREISDAFYKDYDNDELKQKHDELFESDNFVEFCTLFPTGMKEEKIVPAVSLDDESQFQQIGPHKLSFKKDRKGNVYNDGLELWFFNDSPDQKLGLSINEMGINGYVVEASDSDSSENDEFDDVYDYYLEEVPPLCIGHKQKYFSPEEDKLFLPEDVLRNNGITEDGTISLSFELSILTSSGKHGSETWENVSDIPVDVKFSKTGASKNKKNGNEEKVIFRTSDFDGNNVVSKDIFAESKVTMISLWTTWSGPYIKGLSDLESMSSEFEKKGCRIVGICLDADEEKEEAVSILQDAGITYLNLVAPGNVKSILPFENVPTTYFVDSEGNILSDSIEGQDNEYFRNTLDDLLESLD